MELCRVRRDRVVLVSRGSTRENSLSWRASRRRRLRRETRRRNFRDQVAKELSCQRTPQWTDVHYRNLGGQKQAATCSIVLAFSKSRRQGEEAARTYYEDTKIAKKEIESREKNPNSLMPLDIVKALSEEELVDLVEYLFTLR